MLDSDLNETADRHASALRREPSALATAFGVTLAIAILYFGRTVLMPITLGALLSFALTPPMLALRRWHIPRVSSVIIVVLTAFIVVFGIGRLFVSQVSTLASNLPTYQQNLEDKIHSLRGGLGDTDGPFSKTSEMLHRLNQELNGHPQPPLPAAGGQAAQTVVVQGPQSQPPTKGGTKNATATPMMTPIPGTPIPVEIRHPDPAPFQVLQSVIGPLLQPLATAALIILFVISFLLQRENLRDRFIRLVGSGDLQRTTQALDDAGTRVSRYLLLQLLVNTVYAVPIFLGLLLIGVPNALLWALMVLLLRFLPYLGPIIAAIFPLALSLAVDPGWDMLIWTAILFVSVESISGNIIEPWLYGSNTGLSSVAIIVAATFWTWLWGPIGLLLSTPLTVCLVVLGQHAPPLRFLFVLLGNEAALSPHETFYQRLLADDPDEAIDHSEAHVKEQSLTHFYDTVAVPALMLAQVDVERGALSRILSLRIKTGIEEVISWHAPAADPADQAASAGPASRYGNTPLVMCIAGRNDLDEAASDMIAQLLEKAEVPTRSVTMEAVLPVTESSAYDVASMAGIRLICVSLLGTSSQARARMLIRKLRRGHLGDTKILVGLWGATLDANTRHEREETMGCDLIVTSFEEAVAQIKAMAYPENVTLSELSRLVAEAVQKTEVRGQMSDVRKQKPEEP
jgi:predicted PurR-regulated permease PerM